MCSIRPVVLSVLATVNVQARKVSAGSIPCAASGPKTGSDQPVTLLLLPLPFPLPVRLVLLRLPGERVVLGLLLGPSGRVGVVGLDVLAGRGLELVAQGDDVAVALAEVDGGAHDQQRLLAGGGVAVELGPVRVPLAGGRVQQDDRRVLGEGSGGVADAGDAAVLEAQARHARQDR
jgi:hypothetical protein